MISQKKLLTDNQSLRDQQLNELTKNRYLDSIKLKDEVFFPATSCPLSSNLQGGSLVESTEYYQLNSIPKTMFIEKEDSDIPADTTTNSQSSGKRIVLSLVVRAILVILSSFQLYCPLEVAQPKSDPEKFVTVKSLCSNSKFKVINSKLRQLVGA